MTVESPRIFAAQAIAPLRTANDTGSIEIVIDDPCRNELVRVLAYPKFALDETTQKNLLAQADQNCMRLDALRYPMPDSLPLCKDPDDVKFQIIDEIKAKTFNWRFELSMDGETWRAVMKMDFRRDK